MLVRDVMTRSVTTVRASTAIRDAAELMAEQGVTVLPVVDEAARLVGVVGESDVLRGRVLHDPRAGGHHEGGAPPPRTVSEVMTREVITVAPWCDVAEVGALVAERGPRSLPVVDEGEVVGIVTRRDVARVLGRSDEDLRAAVSRKLDAYAGWHRWEVHADRGEVVLCDEYDDPLEQHIATVIAAGVPGTVHIETHRRDACPGHRVRA